MIPLPPDFKDFLKLLNSHEVRSREIIRMGFPPWRIEVLTGASGIEFESCYKNRIMSNIDGIPVNFISPEDLKVNKKAAGRHKDLNDLENLP